MGAHRAVAGHRQATEEADRAILNALIWLGRTGAQWRQLPAAFPPRSTVNDRLHEWAEHGNLQRVWALLLAEYDERFGLEWTWQAADGCMVRAPVGKKGGGAEQGFGRNPTDRGKLGSKRHGLTSGEGLPVASIVTAANVNDVSVLAHLLDARVLEVPEQVRQAGVHLCIDGGYDNRTGHAAARERGLQVHVQPKPGSEQAHVPEGEPRHPARRWVVEVTHAWLNRWRRVQTRWEKRLGHYAAFVELAICMLIWRKIRLKSA